MEWRDWSDAIKIDESMREHYCFQLLNHLREKAKSNKNPSDSVISFIGIGNMVIVGTRYVANDGTECVNFQDCTINRSANLYLKP